MELPAEARTFLSTQRVGVLAVQMADGSPHAATLHFAYIDAPERFIFLTSPAYRKVESLREGGSPASFVVGASEEVMKTLQVDGVVERADTSELREVYFKKFPEKQGKHPGDVFFIFTPTWWRYTDWTTAQGKQIWTSS